MSRIVAAGVSGFLGSRLTSALRAAGHDVVELVRRPPVEGQVQWDPDSGSFDDSVLDGAAAVVNLCGAGVGDKRWTDDYRRLIRTSRVRPTELLARGCAARRVPVLLNASAVGFYGDRGDEVLEETAGPGSTFLAGICRDWEAATAPASEGGTRVVHLRTGLVIGHEGGVLKQLSLVSKLFLGGKLGSGRQWCPWISATDHIDAMRHLLVADVTGPVNLTGPVPVRNKEFVAAIGRAVHRPTPWWVPGPALELVLGGFAQELLGGQRAVPVVLADSGFAFTHQTLHDALVSEVPGAR
ncbi:TIGR01777 family protein [Nakamurella sp. YIM 132087]|uniref:TIGR01777 family protein n=1 Tax=Nakamurella alba TaxID=2665158 RepID=A0A7K1FKV4_9ACTN|nr:TIGR01777 family oxidoreductase [Nakamurella alba]MTD13504.1 TIGR01777 family protein [Nakamurella alba]